MRAAGLAGVSRRRGCRTTIPDRKAAAASDLVRRKFEADAPNRIWTADITYVPTWQGFLYLAVVLDVFSRRIVGWAMAEHMRTELVTDALAMAIHLSICSARRGRSPRMWRRALWTAHCPSARAATS